MFRAGIVASATAPAFYGAGELTGHFPGVLTAAGGHGPLEIGSQAHLFNVASHAGIGCLSAVASGGDCGPGALSAGAGAAATQFIGKAFPHPKTDSGDFVGGLAANSAVGGLASVAGGGKFENGAVTAAFGYMYNQAAQMMRDYDYNPSCVSYAGNTCIPAFAVPLPAAGVSSLIARGAVAAWDALFGGAVRAGAEVGRSAPQNLAEHLTMMEARAGGGRPIMEGRILDPRYSASEGWVKMEVVHRPLDGGSNTVVHYMKNNVTGAMEQFKFK